MTVIILASSLLVSVNASTNSELSSYNETEVTSGAQAQNASETSPDTIEEIPQENIESDKHAGGITEVISRREENVKHFDMGDGTYQAVAYTSAVHRKDADGQWQDIDNRLFVNDLTSSEKIYATLDGRTTVAASPSDDKPLITLSENGYVISMTPVSDREPPKASAQVSNHRMKAAVKAQSISEAAEVSNTTKIKYSDIYEYADVEYVLVSNDIKENIIVKKPGGDNTYTFRITVENLYAEMTEQGEIVFYDSETGVEKYMIPAPYMYDADGVYSTEVYYTLSESGDGYTVKVTADEEWMKSADRSYPVVIDPSINRTVAYDTYINSASPGTNYGSSTELWLSAKETVYIKATMPTLPSGSTLYSADLHVYYYYHSNVTAGSVSATAYMSLMSWSESGLTWNVANQYSSRLGLADRRQSTVTLSGSVGAYVNTPKKAVFDVTNAVSIWYKTPSRNNGIGIKYNSGSSNSGVILKSRESGSTYRAYFVITYTDAIIESGVYKIKNAGNGMYLDVYDSGNTAGTEVIQWSGSTSVKQNHLFKITHVKTLGDLQYYTIRPMTNSGLGLESEIYGSGNRNVTIEEISYTENFDNLLYTHLWVISKNGSAYTIKNGSEATSSYLTAPSNTNLGENIYTATDISSNSKWVFEKYTGSMESVYFRAGGNNLITGETYTYDAYMYSTTIGENGPIQYSVTNTDNTATDKATIDQYTGILKALKPGTIKVKATYSGSPIYRIHTVTIEESLEGSYYFGNAKHGNHYMQIDNNSSVSKDGAILELWDFDGGNDQKWTLDYVGDGYYKIISVASGKTVTAPSGLNDSLEQKTYTGSNTQQWRITETTGGMYKLSPRSNTSYYMSSGAGAITADGRNVEMRQNQSDNADEWYIYKEDNEVCMIGITDDGHDHSSVFGKVMRNLQSLGYSSFNCIVTDYISVSSIRSKMPYSKIFISRSHGGYDSAGTFISISDTSQESFLGTSEIYDFTNKKAKVDLSNVELALFVGCYTSYHSNTSLTDAAVAAGADYSIGFKDSINCNGANKWTESFFNYLEDGNSIEVSAQNATIDNLIYSGISSCVVDN